MTKTEKHIYNISQIEIYLRNILLTLYRTVVTSS